MLQIIYMYTVLLHVALPAVLFVLNGNGLFELTSPDWSQVARDPLALGAALTGGLGLALAHVLPRKFIAMGKSEATGYIVKVCCLELCVVSGFALGLVRKAPELSLPFAVIGLAIVLMTPPKTISVITNNGKEPRP